MTHGFTRMVVGVARRAGGVFPALAQGKMVTLADVTRGEA
ncbi:MAG: efflux RND transporter periplasmic adaptor subunit, partial [Aeromonas veronii]